MHFVQHSRALGTVGVMWGDSMPSGFVHSLGRLLTYSSSRLCGPGEFIHYAHATVSWHELGRSELVEQALGDWLLMLDTDHVFAPDLLDRLLWLRAKHRTRVLSGVYLQKFPPHRPVANMWTPGNGIEALTTWPAGTEIMEVGPVGAGVLLVDTSVFREIGLRTGQAPFQIIQGLSEDYSFCARCRNLGIPVHLAPQVEAHHLAHRHALHVGDYVPLMPADAPPPQNAPPPTIEGQPGSPEPGGTGTLETGGKVDGNESTWTQYNLGFDGGPCGPADGA